MPRTLVCISHGERACFVKIWTHESTPGNRLIKILDIYFRSEAWLNAWSLLSDAGKQMKALLLTRIVSQGGYPVNNFRYIVGIYFHLMYA